MVKKPEIDWTQRVKGVLKAELKRRGMTYADLVERLAAIGVQETEVNIRNKIARGMFSAVFLFQCFEAIEVNELRIS